MKKNKEKLIEEMFKKGILISEDFLKEEENLNISENVSSGEVETDEDMIVLNSDYADVIKQQTSLVDWYELDSLRVEAEKERNDELYQSELQQLKKSDLFLKNESSNTLSNLEPENSDLEVSLDVEEMSSSSSSTTKFKDSEKNVENTINLNKEENIIPSSPKKVNILISYENVPYKYKTNDFTNIFRSRYKFLEKLLRHRQELQSTLTINRLLGKKEREKVSIIGVVEEIGTTKSGHLMLTLEDLTGKIKVLVSKNNKDLFPQAKELVFDEVIGITGTSGDKIIFADNIIWPDIPETNEMKKSEEEEYAIFLSDIHVGSDVFLEKEFNKFLKWIQGNTGNEKQRSLAEKVKYIIIAGDLVDGIGIYPTHEEELKIKNITEQYEEFVRLMKQIPSEKQIIICPGNHDLVHLAEPQPIFYPEFTQCLFELTNLTIVSNPAVVNIGKKENFSGFNVLMYHGYSFDYYVANVESIRNNGGYNRADLIMKFLLKRRHLAPAFKSTPYFPGHKEDPLLIKQIPDFFVTGHIHYSKVANYKGVTMISGSCWQAKTSFQEKLGHEPEPGRVPVVNLKTREVKILKFT